MESRGLRPKRIRIATDRLEVPVQEAGPPKVISTRRLRTTRLSLSR